MRIAYFTDTYQPQINGVTKTLGKLEKYLNASAHEYMVFAPQYPNIEDHMSGPSIMRFRSILFPIYPECRLSLPLYSPIAKKLDAFKPDLIHLVTPLGIGMSGLKYAKENNIPIVSSFHTNFDTYLKYYKLDTLEGILWNFFRGFHANCKINFCPSKDTLETLHSKGIQNLKIWTRGINTEQFSPSHRTPEFIDRFSTKSYTRTNRPLRFLYAGRIAAEKDLDILKNSIYEINKTYADRVEFVFVGHGPYTKNLAQNAPDNVIFTGYLKGHELSKAFASCDVLAFPSGTETLGNVVLEAMASGLPVIAVNSGGVKDNVIDQFNGIMADYRSVDSFAAAIQFMIEHPDLRDVMRRNALEFVQTKTWDSVFDQLLADYETALGKPSKSSQTKELRTA